VKHNKFFTAIPVVVLAVSFAVWRAEAQAPEQIMKQWLYPGATALNQGKTERLHGALYTTRDPIAKVYEYYSEMALKAQFPGAVTSSASWQEDVEQVLLVQNEPHSAASVELTVNNKDANNALFVLDYSDLTFIIQLARVHDDWGGPNTNILIIDDKH
jgi:hypothetical protein